MKKMLSVWLVFGIHLFTGYLYAQGEGQLTNRTVSRGDAPDENSYKNFRFTVGGGYAYWVGKQMKSGYSALYDHLSDLRNGYNLDLDAQYFFHPHSGFGINGNFIKRSASVTDISIPGTMGYYNASYKEINKLTYVGAAYVYRWENDKWGFYMSGGFGPLFYHNESRLDKKIVSFNKVAFATNLSISGERRITRYVGAGLKMAFTAGTIKIDNLPDRMSVCDFMLSGFISFRTK